MAFDTLRVTPLSQRPGSSHSTRSASRASQRPISRLSQRTANNPRIAQLLNNLVKQVTHLNAEYDTEDIRETMDLASKRIDQMKQAVVPDLTQIDAHFRGHIEKARINVQDALANVLQEKYLELKSNVSQRRDLDVEIKSSTLPNHLQFLLLLSSPPTTASLSQAKDILARGNQPVPYSSPLTWKAILSEEPFEGQHWQGAYGLPEGSTTENWESSDSDISSMMDTPSFEDISSSESDQTQLRPPPHVRGLLYSDLKDTRGRALVEALQEKQYWRSGWHTDADLHRPFHMGDASTLGPTLDRILMKDTESFAGPEQEDTINESDAVREVLMALLGHRSCLFSRVRYRDTDSVTASQSPRIVHLTRTSQASILSSFASYALILVPLRDFVHRVLDNTITPSPYTAKRCRTFEAFAAASGRQLLRFEKWCARQEEHICLAQRGGITSNHVVSLLSLEKQVGTELAGTFNILLNIAHSLESRQSRLTPSTMSALVLNALLEAARARFAIGDTSTAQSLVDVWRETAEPLWANVGRWLKDGIPIRIGFEGDMYRTEPTWDDKEFFIRTTPLVDIASPDFWEGGFTLFPSHNDMASRTSGREGEKKDSGIPSFLQHVADDVLAAGKAISLLRALDKVQLLGENWLEGWSKFETLTTALPLRGLDDALENLISDDLLPPCRLVQSCLGQVLVEECDLWKHVLDLENVYLMARGDAMSQFGEKLFARMDTRQNWNDFHFLNTAFRDVSKMGARSWINPTLVRISYRGSKDRSITRTVRAIDGLSIEYAVPFPLTYIFGPETNASYSSLFCFLLQIRRSKNVLDRILIRGLNRGLLNYGMPDLKAFYTLRSKLSWFVNTFMNFILTNVVHAGLLEFHSVLRKATSLDEMIQCHRSHLHRLLGRCLLQANTSALHRSILSILDLSLHFSDCLAAFAGETSLDVSRHSLIAVRHRHRRRGHRGRIHRPDVIGFVEALPPSEEDSDSESDGQDEVPEPSSVSASGVSISFVEESFFTRLEKMSLELDGLVRFVRRGVESLAGGDGEAAATFGVLAFSLEDWDL